jgi:asparagine N-glycosylation enzyme membrane subunit Stt3
MRRCAVFVLAVGERPHPWRTRGRRGGSENSTDDESMGAGYVADHIIVVLPFSAGTTLRNSSKQEIGHTQLMAIYPALFDRALERPAFFGSR